MGAITIRRLDDEVIESLRKRAEQNGRSMEEESRRILTEAVNAPQQLSGREAVEHFRDLRKRLFGDRMLPDSTETLQEIREEDPTISPPDAGYS